MKSRVFTLTSLIALLVAMMAANAAMAQTPAQDVYNPNGEVLDVVEGGGETLPESDCSEADGVGPNGGPVTPGSEADCAETVPADEVCAQADGLDAAGNDTTYGSSADCAENEVASVCAEADGQDGDGNTVAYGSDEDCSAATTPTVSEGELPFTGFEAGIVALAGMALLGGGFAMRRVARRDSL